MLTLVYCGMKSKAKPPLQISICKPTFSKDRRVRVPSAICAFLPKLCASKLLLEPKWHGGVFPGVFRVRSLLFLPSLLASFLLSLFPSLSLPSLSLSFPFPCPFLLPFLLLSLPFPSLPKTNNKKNPKLSEHHWGIQECPKSWEKICEYFCLSGTALIIPTWIMGNLTWYCLVTLASQT